MILSIFWCPVKFEGNFLKFSAKYKIGNLSIFLCDPLCLSIKIDFCGTQMMPLSFVVRGQKFGALSLLRCPSPNSLKSSLSGRKRPTEQLNEHFPEKPRHSKFCQDTGVICSHRFVTSGNHKIGLI